MCARVSFGKPVALCCAFRRSHSCVTRDSFCRNVGMYMHPHAILFNTVGVRSRCTLRTRCIPLWRDLFMCVTWLNPLWRYAARCICQGSQTPSPTPSLPRIQCVCAKLLESRESGFFQSCFIISCVHRAVLCTLTYTRHLHAQIRWHTHALQCFLLFLIRTGGMLFARDSCMLCYDSCMLCCVYLLVMLHMLASAHCCTCLTMIETHILVHTHTLVDDLNTLMSS